MLTDKIAVITGGSRGIGKAIALQLAQAGCDCLLVAHRAENLQAAAAQIRQESDRRIEICPTDLRTLVGCEVVYSMAEQLFGEVDILVNCAGATQGGRFLEQADNLWEDGFALKFHGAVRLSRLFWPMLTESHGTVINIIGGAARTPNPDFMIGGAVNAALANFSKALAGQGLRDDVNVNAIHPGMTVTERLDELYATRAALAGTSLAEAKQASIAQQGLRRLGTPEDVAALAVFLCTSAARHIQGTAIAVDGGATTGLY